VEDVLALTYPKCSQKKKNIYFWRACHNLLPTKDNLPRRKAVKEPFCPICEREPEAVMHAIWSYLVATDVCGCSKIVFQKCAMEGNDFLHAAEHILARCGKEDSVLFIHLAHRIWMRRNKWVHEGKLINPNILVQVTTKYVEEFQKVNETIPVNVESIKNQGIRWSAPTRGWYKANWDVAIDKSCGRMGIDVVIRDEKGQVIVATSKTRLGSFEPTTGEALASFRATSLCRDLGIQQLFLEGDAKLVVDAINLISSTWSRFGHVVEDHRVFCKHSQGGDVGLYTVKLTRWHINSQRQLYKCQQ
jgi:hypothetical protein